MAESAVSWDEVERDPRFRALSPSEKASARKEYFYDVVVPQLDPEEIGSAWSEFVADTEPAMMGLDKKQSTSEYIGNKAKQGLASGLAFAVGGAADIVSTPGMILGAAGVPVMHDPTRDPGGWTPNVAGLQEALGHSLGVRKGLLPPSKGAGYSGSVAEFGASTILPSSAVVKQAPNKITAFLSELGSTAGGGLGYELAGTPGGIIGGVGSASLPAAVTKGIAKLAPSIGGALRQTSASSMAGKELSGALEADPRSGQNMDEAAAVARYLESIGAPGFRPTLGQRSGAEGVISREHQIATSSPADLGRYSERMKENAAVVGRGMDIAFPQRGSVTAAAKGVSEPTVTELEAKLANIDRQRKAIAGNLPASSRQAAGDKLVELRAEAQATAREILRGKIRGVYQTADSLGVAEDMTDVVGFVNGIKNADVNAFQKMPPVFGRVLDEFSEKPRNDLDINALPEGFASAQSNLASFEKLHSLWRETNSQLGTAMRAGDANQQFFLGRLRDILKSKLDKYEGAEYGDLGKQFREFNKFYSSKYAPAFKEGVGGRMVATGKRGRIMPPEDIVSKFFTPSGIDDFNLVYGTSKSAQDALRGGVFALFRKAAVKNGEIDQKAADEFLRKNAETLDKLPDIRAALSSPITANRAMVEAAKETKKALADFDKTYIAQLSRSTDPTKLIDSALSGDQRALHELVNLGRDADGKAAVARAIAERIPYVAEKLGKDPLAFVVANEKSLRSAMDRLGPKHFDNLKYIMGAQTVLGRAKPAHTVTAGKVGDPLQEAIGTSGQSLMNMLRVVFVTRAAGVHSMGTVLSGKFWLQKRQKAADLLTREAIYDPQIADDLVKAIKSGGNVPKPLANSILNHLAALGFRVDAATDEDQQ